ncbi:peptidase U32 family protein [Fundicoccus culcitae]|uniref:peptidase U32 family protein n=1 Tax=Fundicoccus culcitae TaxID=2969821 RepID=UPI0028BF0E37|nr:U32 family peptidase [Fundicoccus culcitae]
MVAANAILHNDKIAQARPFLKRMKALGADQLLVGDTGLIQIMKDPEYALPYIYDASVLVTSSSQINFWAKYGAVAAVVAREVPFVELEVLAQEITIPAWVQVYGAQCIHQSGRPLLENYAKYVGKVPTDLSERHLYLSEPDKPDTHYSIFSDSHGTHVFANNDVNLMEQLEDLHGIGLDKWYLDGLFAEGDDFVEIVGAFDKARRLIEAGEWGTEVAADLAAAVEAAHPAQRGLDTGFFLYPADKVK